MRTFSLLFLPLSSFLSRFLSRFQSPSSSSSPSSLFLCNSSIFSFLLRRKIFSREEEIPSLYLSLFLSLPLLPSHDGNFSVAKSSLSSSTLSRSFAPFAALTRALTGPIFDRSDLTWILKEGVQQINDQKCSRQKW